MLESISIKNVATYDATGVEIKNLKKINFIYGANGCGKTTLSKFIYSPTHSDYQNCNLAWKNGTVIRSLIFNKDFRDRNFGNGKIVGVFTLGEDAKDLTDQIDKLEIELDKIRKQQESYQKTLTEKEVEIKTEESNFQNKFWEEIYKFYERDFKGVFHGFMNSKEKLKSKVLEEFNNNNEIVSSMEELKEKYNTIFDTNRTLLEEISLINFERILEIEQNSIWKKNIIGKEDVKISALIKSLNIADWVNQGRLHIENNRDICPFCQQNTINEDFKEQLESYFDETFMFDTKTVKSLSDEYNDLSKSLELELEKVELEEKNKSNTNINIELFSSNLKTLKSQFLTNRERFNNKILEPSRIVEYISTDEQLKNINKLITECNDIIKSHNSIVNDYVNQKSVLIKLIWKYMVHNKESIIKEYKQKIKNLDTAIQSLNNSIKTQKENFYTKNNEIREANKKVSSTQTSIDEINGLLTLYGFSNFKIVSSKNIENHYQIQRNNGTDAELTLSEGEATFISFLYFLQLAKGSIKNDSISEPRILVIDDPISSLDSNVLFVISSLIKEIIKDIKADRGNIKQLILLTHNVFFHKEVSFVDGRTPENGNTHFWVLRKNNNVSNIQTYEAKNPINTSYELLWLELKNSQKNSFITIQNVMRRIIENYFKITGNYAYDRIIDKFDKREEKEICRSLICWINDGSHCLSDDLFVEQQDSAVEKYLHVFKEIFEKTGHQEHYKMMYER